MQILFPLWCLCWLINAVRIAKKGYKFIKRKTDLPDDQLTMNKFWFKGEKLNKADKPQLKKYLHQFLFSLAVLPVSFILLAIWSFIYHKTV